MRVHARLGSENLPRARVPIRAAAREATLVSIDPENPRVADVHRIHVRSGIQYPHGIPEACSLVRFVPPQGPGAHRAADRLRDPGVEIKHDGFLRFTHRGAWVLLLETPARDPLDLGVFVERPRVIAEGDRADPDARIGAARRVAGRRAQERMVNPQRERLRIWRDVGDQLAGLIGRERHDGLDLRVIGEGFHPRRVKAAPRRVESERPLIDAAQPAHHVGRIAHEERCRINEHAARFVCLDRQRGNDRCGERVANVFHDRARSAGGAITEVLFDHQHPRSRAMEVNDARIHDAAIERHLHRAAAAGRRHVVEDVLVEARNFHEHAAARRVPIKRHEAIRALQCRRSLGDVRARRLLRLDRADTVGQQHENHCETDHEQPPRNVRRSRDADRRRRF